MTWPASKGNRSSAHHPFAFAVVGTLLLSLLLSGCATQPATAPGETGAGDGAASMTGFHERDTLLDVQDTPASDADSASSDSSSDGSASKATSDSSASTPANSPASSSAAASASAEAPSSAASASADNTPASPLQADWPTGWLATPQEDVPAGEPVRILSLPDMSVHAHANGVEVSEKTQAKLDEQLPTADEGCALVEYEGNVVQIDATALLVNLPDIMPQANYDIVYSYASTSACGAYDIPGVTGQHIDGYAEGAQPNKYWGEDCFVVPCAYGTAQKAGVVADALADQGFRLLVFDAYRPMTAQYHLSDALVAACDENPDLYGELSWGLGWYVAPGASGHNFGTDLDVGVCNADGEPIAMPSAFDAFDETGHLTDAPMTAAEITPDAYRAAVTENEACMALHAACVQAGFSELASEWWHFADDETEAAMRGLNGDVGLDFTALL